MWNPWKTFMNVINNQINISSIKRNKLEIYPGFWIWITFIISAFKISMFWMFLLSVLLFFFYPMFKLDAVPFCGDEPVMAWAAFAWRAAGWLVAQNQVKASSQWKPPMWNSCGPTAAGALDNKNFANSGANQTARNSKGNRSRSQSGDLQGSDMDTSYLSPGVLV